MPAKRRRQAVEAPAPEPEPVLEATEKRKKRRFRTRSEVIEELPIVEHASHGKVPSQLFLFGDGDCGQLGFGEDVTEKLRPFPLEVGSKKFLQVACGGMHTVALTEDGEVYSWGVNDEGALGRETAGELWEKSGLATGKPLDSYVPGKLEVTTDYGKVVQISAGDSHTAVLTSKGFIYLWGTFRDASGVMGFSPKTRIQLLPVLVYEPTSESGADQVIKITSGADHVLCLTRENHVLSFGNGQQGQLGRFGPRMTDRTRLELLLQPHVVTFKRTRAVSARIIDVFCGSYSSFALTHSGHIWAWGLNNYGQLALPGDLPVYSPTVVSKLAPGSVKLLAPGQHHTLAITDEGKLLSWGRPTYGRLGRGDVDSQSDSAVPEPGPVEGLDGVVVAGAAGGLAVSGCFSDDGRVWTWGFGTNSQLGKGDDDEDELVPKQVAETKRFKEQRTLQLLFGGQHTALLAVDRQAPAVKEPAAKKGKAAAAGKKGKASKAAAAAGVEEGDKDKEDGPSGEAAGGEAEGISGGVDAAEGGEDKAGDEEEGRGVEVGEGELKGEGKHKKGEEKAAKEGAMAVEEGVAQENEEGEGGHAEMKDVEEK